MAQAQSKSKDQATEPKGAENKAPEAVTPDPDADLKATIAKALQATGLPQATIDRMIADAVRDARVRREAEALEAQRAEITKVITKLLAPIAKDLRTAMDLGYDLGYGNLAITVPVDAEGNRMAGKISVDLVSPVGVRRSPQGGGGSGGAARSGEQWKVSGPGIDEILGSPSTAAQRILPPSSVTGKPASVNGRNWWGVPQEAPVGHKATKTYKGSIFTIERIA